MERRPGEQRLKIGKRQGRCAHKHGHGLPSLDLDRAPDHLYDPPPLHGQGPAGRQVYPLHQHHRQAREGLRQQVPRVHEGGEGVRLPVHGQRDGPGAAPLIPPVDEIPDRANAGDQQAEAVDGHPQGHRAEKHPARPGAGPAQGHEQQPASQQERRCEQGQQRPQILPAAEDQRRRQQAPDPSQRAKEPRPSAQSQQIPHRASQGRKRRPFRTDGHPAQGAGQLQQQPVHGEVVQQKPFQADPHATSTTMTVMSSRCPFCRAASMRSSASRSRDRVGPFLSSASRSFPKRS